jgi:Kelch motif
MPGTWFSLSNQPSFTTSTMILLTDGRVMVQEERTTHWHALKPDIHGSYLNGSWHTLADMSIWRRYYASGVLKDGRVIICGGEQNGTGPDDTNICEIYDPAEDTWTIIPSPAQLNKIGDAPCSVLPDGRFMIGSIFIPDCAIYNPATNSWSAVTGKAIASSEETWVLLPDGTILTAQCYSPYSSEKYIISSNTWKNEGPIPVSLVNPNMNEIGPAMLLYNGRVIYFGAESSGGFGKTAIYTLPSSPGGTGSWVAGPDIPKINAVTMVCNDCPATIMPNGKVLFTVANYLSSNWGTPIYFFEYDPVMNSISQAPTPVNNNTILYESRLMLLPTGEVLFCPTSSNIQMYIPDGGPQDNWRPNIISVAANLLFGVTYSFTVSGTQLNGLSQANMYGDDCYASTNYPIARLTNQVTGNVYFQYTFDFSTMGVATGTVTHTFKFSTAGLPYGTYDLSVIANGIASNIVTISFKIQKGTLIDTRYKRELELFTKEIVEGDPWDKRQWVVDPEIIELRSQIKSLQNSVNRLNSIIKTAELPNVGKKAAMKERNTGKSGKEKGEK